MRIIDKNTDFYDYLQNVYYDKTFTFDRRNSYLLTKELLCKSLSVNRRYRFRHKNNNDYIDDNYLLLQICNTFWLFLVKITKFDEYDIVQDYKMSLLCTWKNYDKPRVLIKLERVHIWFSMYDDVTDIYEKEIDALKHRIDTNDYRMIGDITAYEFYKGNHPNIVKVVKDIPILKACGIGECIDPLDVFLSFEEYFSLEKTSSERRDPKGITDVDKVESHGFDKKTSFRGKYNKPKT